jgi:xanthine/uracil permease
MPIFDLVMIVTMTLVMIVVMIESTGMFLALGDMTGKQGHPADAVGRPAHRWPGHLIGGIFNTFPYTSFSQNVGLVGVTGIKSRFVCVAGGLILIVLGLIPKMGALVESVPTMVLGGAGLVMFGMVAATGIRILAGVDFQEPQQPVHRRGLASGMGMIPLVAPELQAMDAARHPPADRKRHPAGLDRRGGPERLLQIAASRFQ